MIRRFFIRFRFSNVKNLKNALILTRPYARMNRYKI